MDSAFGIRKNLNGRENRLLMTSIALASQSRDFGLEVISSCRSFGIGAPCLCNFAGKSIAAWPSCFAPRIFLRPSPTQAIPLEMLKRLEQEQVRAEAAEAAEAKGKRRGPFLSTSQRVTFSSCSIHSRIF